MSNRFVHLAKKSALRTLNARGYQVSHESVLPPTGDHVRMLKALKKRGLECSFVLDIGALFGGWTRNALDVFTEAESWMFEPQPNMLAHLSEVHASYPRTQIFQCGLGSAESTSFLTISPGPLHSCSTFAIGEQPDHQFLPPAGANAKPGVWHQIPIPIRCFDAILREHPAKSAPQLIKLDVEGYEIEVLKGASSILGKTEVIIAEVGVEPSVWSAPTIGELSTFLEGQGYRLYDFADIGYSQPNGRLCTIDVVFVLMTSPLFARR